MNANAKHSINEEFEGAKEVIDQKKEMIIRFYNSQLASSTQDHKLKDKAEDFLDINILKEKTVEILSNPNSPELEIYFRKTRIVYKSNPIALNSPLSQAYQSYLKGYERCTSLYIFNHENNITKLYIYSTETGAKNTHILQTLQPLDYSTCMAKLPNNKLFCFGNHTLSGASVIIDESYGVQVLPYGAPCCYSSSIYFNNNVYCFGGYNWANLTLSTRFDLDQNRWIKLTPLPEPDLKCSSIIINGNILITGYYNTKVLVYSVDTDSFSAIPHIFAAEKRKILINAVRLYVIEWDEGSIYESEIGDEYFWRLIAKTPSDYANQVYYSYNKGGMYIGITDYWVEEFIRYYKFELNKKIIRKLD